MSEEKFLEKIQSLNQDLKKYGISEIILSADVGGGTYGKGDARHSALFSSPRRRYNRLNRRQKGLGKSGNRLTDEERKQRHLERFGTLDNFPSERQYKNRRKDGIGRERGRGIV